MRNTRSHFRLLFPVIALASALSCGDDDADPVSPGENVADVYTAGDTYIPTIVEIDVGGTVRFNMGVGSDGLGHNAIFVRTTPGAPADIEIVANAVVSRVFTTRGTFRYNCTVHPGMAGEVDVR